MGGEPIDESLLYCDYCRASLYLVVQIYAPLDDGKYHRIVYIFGCNNATCSHHKYGSFKAFRRHWEDSSSGNKEELALATSETATSPAPAPAPLEKLFEESDDWGMEEDGWGEEDGMEDLTENIERLLSIRNQTTDVTNNDSNNNNVNTTTTMDNNNNNNYNNKQRNLKKRPCFQSFQLHVEEEDSEDVSKGDSSAKLTAHEKELLAKYTREHGKISFQKIQDPETFQDTEWAGESYERMSSEKQVGKAFLKFQKKIQNAPEQCLRYPMEFGNNKPLLYTEDRRYLPKDVVGCECCGAPRCFEFQVMPALLRYLDPWDPAISSDENSNGYDRQDKGGSSEHTKESLFLGMDWGTLLVYVCSKDCDALDHYHEEALIVQPDVTNLAVLKQSLLSSQRKS